MESKPEAFLRNPKAYLEGTVDYFGYDSCHKIEGLDASECAKDCEKASESNFAKRCSDQKGFFKCCIRLNSFLRS